MLISMLKTMAKTIFKLKKLIFIIFLSLLINTTPAFTKIYKNLKIIGNERLSVETIIMFSELNIKNDISNYDLNKSIKKLYKTNYFEDIKIFSENDILIISIKENPIVQSIQINGVNNKSILEELQKITKKKRKISLS